MGFVMGAHDLLIAATGLAFGYAVVTRNVGELARTRACAARWRIVAVSDVPRSPRFH